VIDKAKAQLPGSSLPVELPIILRESIPFVRFLTCYMVFLTNVLCPHAVPLRFSNQRQDVIMLSKAFTLNLVLRFMWDFVTSIWHVSPRCGQTAESEVSIFLRIFSIYL